MSTSPRRTDKIHKYHGHFYTIKSAFTRFASINGMQWAAAFAYYAFFSLSPLIIIMVTVSSLFFDKADVTTRIIDGVQTVVPIGTANQQYIFNTITGVIQGRGQASVLAFIMLVWASLGFVSSLIRAISLAWNTRSHSWWKLPIKGFVLVSFLVIAAMMSLLVPVIVKLLSRWLLFRHPLMIALYHGVSNGLSAIVIFISLTVLYKIAPNRPTRFSEVWAGSLLATLLLKAAEGLFVVYLRYFATFNAVYGAFGGIIALMMWIYLSGCIFIYGACLCAVRADRKSHTAHSARSPIEHKR